MKLLFVSYKAPPTRAARAARLASLGRWLMRRGHRLEVYAVDTGGADRLMLEKLEGARIVRTPPGPLERARQALAATGASRRAGSSDAAWITAKDVVQAALVPDQQVEWARHLVGRVPVEPPDVVVSFVPPFTGALVGHELARRFGAAHVLDYGDPWSVSSEAGPGWRAALEHRLERRILRRAAGAVVNAPSHQRLLERDFGDLVDVACLYSGYDLDEYEPDPPPPGDELRHLGALYGVRIPLDPLARAVDAHPRFDRIVLHGERHYVDLPGAFEEREPVPYREALRLMQTAAALMVIGNRGGLQIPSKTFTYLGAGRPVLAVVESLDDPLARLELGDQVVVVPNREAALRNGLDRIGERVGRRFDPPPEYRWERIAARYESLLRAWRG